MPDRPHLRPTLGLLCALHLCLAGCPDETPARTPTGDSTPGDTVVPDNGSSPDGFVRDQSLTDASGDALPGKTAADWILNHFAGDPVMTGDFSSRTTVEAPHLVMNATGTNAKYAFETKDQSPPNSKEVGFIDVNITDLVSADAYGGGILTGDPGMVLYLSRVYIEPNWPMWQSYSTTNKDGIVLDGATAFYAEDLTIKSFNADAAIDNKASVSQMVRLTIDGPGNRSIRYWGSGPHYLVGASIDNPGTVGDGALIWIQDCSTTTLNVYDSKFNGASTIPPGTIVCENGSSPQITYLSTDPRTTGDMHPMFVAP